MTINDDRNIEGIREQLQKGLHLPVKYCPWKPSPRQAAYLLVPHFEAFYGGAAGGGKSIALLMAASQYVEHPEYRALLLRRTFKDLSQPEALMDLGHRWWGATDAKWNQTEKEWRFPSGARIKFGYMDTDKDKFQYQGAAYHFVGFDELTQFTEPMYTYLISRVRKREGLDLPLRMRAAANPGGIGHEWVKKRFIEPLDMEVATDEDIKQRAKRIFIPSTIDQNPHLNQEEYKENLRMLDPVTRAQLLNGDWDIEAEGNMFKAEWFDNRLLPYMPPDVKIVRKVRYWDLAASDISKLEDPGDPDWTASCLMALGDDGQFYVLQVTQDRLSPEGVAQLVKKYADADGKAGTAIVMEQEPGSSGVAVTTFYQQHILRGYNFKADRPTGNKVERAAPASAMCEQGLVYIVEGAKTKKFINELVAFPMGSHDDMVDAFSGALSILSPSVRLRHDYRRRGSRGRPKNLWG